MYMLLHGIASQSIATPEFCLSLALGRNMKDKV